MNYKELLKKYWFLLVVALAGLVFICLYSVEAIKNQDVSISPKQKNGEYLIYEIDGNNTYTANDLYKDLYTLNGSNALFTKFALAVLNEAYTTTSDMEAYASTYAQYYLSYYGEDYIDQLMRSYAYNGIDDLKQYFIDYRKQLLILKDYYSEHAEEYLEPFLAENKPVIASHILVLIENVEKIENEDGTYTLVAHPSEAEEKKLNDIKEALKTKDFADVAYTFSDDSTAQNGGYLGYVDINNTSYVTEFKNGCLEAVPNEVSEPVLSTYGYHFILVKNDIDSLFDDGSFISALETKFNNRYLNAIVEKANALGFEVFDESLKTQIADVTNEESAGTAE